MTQFFLSRLLLLISTVALSQGNKSETFIKLEGFVKKFSATGILLNQA